MANPCPTCEALDCLDFGDPNLYSISGPIYPFIFSCPSGYDCNGSDSFNMLCCGQQLSVQFPPSATVDDKQTLIQGIVNQCAVRQLYCGDLPNTPGTPVTLFYNRSKKCTVPCPDGNLFTYTVAAGTFAATTQDEADTDAANFACVQAGLRRVCLGAIPSCLCVGASYSTTIPHSGGIPPFVFSLVNGVLPPGLSLNAASGLVSGTPASSGQYAFSIQITEPDGSFMVKPYGMTVLQITTTTIPPYQIGVPYSFQLVVTGGSGQYAWAITSGTLPAGLTMSVTGLISGTPT